MLERYSRKCMKDIWSEKSKYESWLKVEIYSAEAYAKYNKNITKKDLINLNKNAHIDINRINELELETKHDIVAFTRQISETLGEEKKWVHYGLTSTDVVDTAQSYRLKKANKIILKDLIDTQKIIHNIALEHKNTYMIGRTHGVHAEITTFGYKLAIWYDQMDRNIKRFKKASKQVEIAKIAGAVGNYANVPLGVQDYVAKMLGLNSSLISSQVIPRDRHAEYIQTLALIATTLEQFATELRQLQRTEIGEVSEYFAQKQKGSSAMPHKKNPIGLENISGLARMIRGFTIPSLDNIVLWNERDISHSSVERIILPDSTSLIDYMLTRFNGILNNLSVNKNKMLENINLTKGLIFSQKAMLKLIDSKKISREDAYAKIQPLTLKALKEGLDFGKLLIENKLFNNKEIKELFDLKYYSSNIDLVFKRLKIQKKEIKNEK